MDEAQADFALNLLRSVATGDEPAVISPFSIAVALAMTYDGAQGTTKEQMTNVLARGQSAKQFDEYVYALLSDIGKKNKSYTLDTANRLYLGEKFVLKEAYQKIIQTHYAGQLRQVDFKQVEAIVK
ncbi:unnamed protein product, partial [Gongylonema pulchrum]|uniref:SERPIN domain-containing protein n=1 Tax=Gongylonema pulchrum TaxID=637853 RepID=A0A183D9K4_9BILA